MTIKALLLAYYRNIRELEERYKVKMNYDIHKKLKSYSRVDTLEETLKSNTMNAHNAEISNNNSCLPTLKGAYNERSLSPIKHPIHHNLTKSTQDPFRSPPKDVPQSEFIDKHKSFYDKILKKIKADGQSKKNNSIFKNPNLFPSRRAKSNTSNLDDALRPNYIQLNRLKVIEKPPVKKFKYLAEHEQIQRAVEPKRLIEGLDQLYEKIDKMFTKTKKETSEQESQNAAKKTEEKNTKNQLVVREEAIPRVFRKEQDYSFYVRRDDEKLEISFEDPRKKVNKNVLPQIRSNSQPRSTQRRPSQQNVPHIDKNKQAENIQNIDLEPEICDLSVSIHDPTFIKMINYVKNGGIDSQGADDIKDQMYDFYDHQGESLSPERVRSSSEKKKRKEPVKILNQHKLPARTVIKCFKDEAFILANYNLNKAMCKNLGEALSKKDNLNTLVFVNNKLGDETISTLLEPIMSNPVNIQVFRHVKNYFAKKFLGIFEKKFFSLDKNCLKELVMDGCKATDEDFELLIRVIQGARSRLRYLGLAYCELKDNAVRALGRFIAGSEYLISLDVGWNRMGPENVKYLLESIRLNKTLRHLNLSGNNIRNLDSTNGNAQIIKNLVINYHQLIHINLSYTSLTELDVMIVIEGVKNSKSVMSLHLSGNKLPSLIVERVNAILTAKKSVLHGLPPFDESLDSRCYTTMQNGCNFKLRKNADGMPYVHNMHEKDFSGQPGDSTNLIYYRILDNAVTHENINWIQSQNCWICERWRRVQILYKLPQVDKNKQKEKQEAEAQGARRSRRANRMSSDLTDELDTNFPQSGRDDVRVIATFTRGQSIKMLYNSQQRAFEYSTFVPPGVHHYEIRWFDDPGSQASKILLEGDVQVKPRESEVCYAGDPSLKEQPVPIQESFIKERSVFADFRLDDGNVLKRTFEADIRRFRLEEFLQKKEELDKILVYLYRHFERIKSIFLYYASISLYPFISFEKVVECLDECHGLSPDYKREVNKICMRVRDADPAPGVPQDGLKRHAFMEVLLEAALKLNPKKIVEISAANIEKFFEEYILQHARNSDEYYHGFRIHKIYTSSIDRLMKANIDALEAVFKKHKQLFGLDMKNVFEIVKVPEVEVTDKELLRIYAHSKMTIIDDEKDLKKYNLFTFVEFLEFLVRLAEHCVKKGELTEKLSVFLKNFLKAHKQPFYKSISEL